MLSYKIVVLGNSCVGKSSLTIRIVKNKFIDNLEPSIGAAFLSLKVNDKMLEFWDTAGQERFNSLLPMYYRGADIALIIFDVTNKQSYISAQNWVNIIKNNQPSTIIILIGNKIDLPMKGSFCYDAEFYSIYDDILYIDVSAKTGLNIEELKDIIINSLPSTKYEKQELVVNESNNCCY